MTDLLAVDPSVRSPGAALFRNGILIAASRVKVDFPPEGRGDRCAYVANKIIDWAYENHGSRIETLVYEWPQWYAASKSKGDPNDLAGLVGIGAEIGGQLSGAIYEQNLVLTRITPTPAEWIGNLPKNKTGNPWASPRGLRIKDRLSLGEIMTVVASHDSIDAIGLGLFALGRLTRKRVFARE